ncbi:MAG: pantetheine-phosphate adenylyltransferase [Chloroflexi bacterium]|nr:pantetheine-phosphate adenylyltransferase [Chloroflexota bacterium]
MTIALYPGSFDPVTYGHLDIAQRAAALFDEVVIAVYATPDKKRVLFTTEERMGLVEEAVKDLANVRVLSYSGLTVEAAREINAQVIIRGLRMVSDFEREFEMALMNKKLAPDIELVTLMSSLEHQFVSSSLLKEVVKLGGDPNSFVPPHVGVALMKKLLP